MGCNSRAIAVIAPISVIPVLSLAYSSLIDCMAFAMPAIDAYTAPLVDISFLPAISSVLLVACRMISIFAGEPGSRERVRNLKDDAYNSNLSVRMLNGRFYNKSSVLACDWMSIAINCNMFKVIAFSPSTVIRKALLLPCFRIYVVILI